VKADSPNSATRTRASQKKAHSSMAMKATFRRGLGMTDRLDTMALMTSFGLLRLLRQTLAGLEVQIRQHVFLGDG
jgi:hypothetical protein